MSITVKCSPRGPLQENTYVVRDDATGLYAIVDPGCIGDDIRAEIGDRENLKLIMLTHGHPDHFHSAADYISEYPDALFVAPEKEKYLLNKGGCPVAGRYVTEGDTVSLGETEFSFIETPGHTEGGMCILTGKFMFSGDTLFRLSVGNTSFETGDWDTLESSIKNKLFTLDEDIVVYPGHGSPTTIGFEKKANPFV